MALSEEAKKAACEDMWIDTMKDSLICSSVKSEIIARKCQSDSTLLDDVENFKSEECAKYCTNIPDGCHSLFKNYCTNVEIGRNNYKKYCLEFCNKPENKAGCLKSIIKSCSNKEIITDKFCQNTISLADQNMKTKYETAMTEYCSNKEIVKNPDLFCGCYNKEVLDQELYTYKTDPTIREPYIHNFLKANTQCLDKCVNPDQDENAFKIKEDCTIEICEKHAREIMHVVYRTRKILDPNHPYCNNTN